MIRMTELVEQVGEWLNICFGRKIAEDKIERTDRFIEEALELAQTTKGWHKERAYALADYVFGRPVGEPHQEVGGVMITLSALCYARGINLENASLNELSRINRPHIMEKIKEKQASKDENIKVDEPMTALPDSLRRRTLVDQADALLTLAESLSKADTRDLELEGVYFSIGYARGRAYDLYREAGEYEKADEVAKLWSFDHDTQSTH